MDTIVLLLSPLLGAVVIGVVAAMSGLFGLAEARVFSRFAFSVAMPVAVFNFMRSSDLPDWHFAGMICGYILALAATASVIFVVARRIAGADIRQAGAVVFTGTCGNAVFLGLPIAISVPGWGVPFLTLMIFEGVMVFATGAALMTWPDNDADEPPKIRKSVSDAILRACKNPIVIGLFAGLFLAALGVDLPDFIDGPVTLFGGIASPFGLFVLGLYLVILGRDQEKMPVKLLAAVLPLKLIAFPLLTFGLVWLFSRDMLLATVASFFTAMPPAISSVVFAATYQQYEREVAAMVVVGSLIGLCSIVGFLGFALA